MKKHEKKAQTTTNILRQIKNSERHSAPVTLWLAYRYPNPKEDSETGKDVLFHRVRRLDIDDKLSKSLRGIVNRAIDSAKRLEEYTFEGAVEDETALYEETKETEFSSLLKLIKKAGKDDVVEKEIHLNRAYAYVIELEPSKGNPIYAFRRLSKSWKAKEVKGLINAILQNKVLVTMDEENVFRFESRIDFFASQDFMFVLQKGNFESGLHFRAGMEKKRDELLNGLKKTNLYSGLDMLHELSTTHVRWLKKLAGAYNHGKCTTAAWVEELMACCTEKKWNVKKDSEGRVQVTLQNRERVLRLMNDDLLESPVDSELFEIDGAKRSTS